MLKLEGKKKNKEDETEQDPVGLLGTKAFLCPPVS